MAAKSRADRALVAGMTGVERGRLHLLLAEASRWSGEHEVARENARGAMHALPPASNDWYAAIAEVVESALTLGNVDEAKAAVALLKDTMPAEKTTATRIIAMARIAERLVMHAVFDVADALLVSAEKEGSDVIAKDAGARAFVLAARVAKAKWFGDLEEAAILAQDAIASFDVVGDVRNAARQRHNAGFALVHLGVFAMAESTLREAIASAERLNLVGVASEAKRDLGQLCVRMGRRDEGITLFNEVIAGFALQRDRLGEGRARAYLAGALHVGQAHAAAEEEALRALPLLDPSPSYRAALLGLMALTFADKGDGENAFKMGSDAMRLLQETGGTVEGESIVRIGYAEGLRARGDVEGAKKAVAEARDRLLARASKIKNPEWRRGFLGSIQEHIRTLARAGEWLV